LNDDFHLNDVLTLSGGATLDASTGSLKTNGFNYAFAQNSADLEFNSVGITFSIWVYQT